MEFKIEQYYDNEDILKNYEQIKKNNISEPYLRNNERAAIIGLRAVQISLNAPLFIPIPKDTDDVQVFAERELEARKSPLILKRFSGKHVDYWKIEDLL